MLRETLDLKVSTYRGELTDQSKFDDLEMIWRCLSTNFGEAPAKELEKGYNILVRTTDDECAYVILLNKNWNFIPGETKEGVLKIAETEAIDSQFIKNAISILFGETTEMQEQFIAVMNKFQEGYAYYIVDCEDLTKFPREIINPKETMKIVREKARREGLRVRTTHRKDGTSLWLFTYLPKVKK
jgi:hypothetical protein